MICIADVSFILKGRYKLCVFPNLSRNVLLGFRAKAMYKLISMIFVDRTYYTTAMLVFQRVPYYAISDHQHGGHVVNVQEKIYFICQQYFSNMHLSD